MPLITVKAVAGRTAAQKRALVREVTEAVVRNFKVEADSVMVDIIEYSGENIAQAGRLFADC